MGQAHKSPQSNYCKQLYIATHAIDRFRERLPDGDELSHRGPDDLANLVDECVVKAMEAGRSEPIMDKGDPAVLVDLTGTRGEGLFALVRPNSREDSRWAMAVVTLLDKQQVAETKAAGTWRQSNGSLFGVFNGGSVAKLGDKFAALLRTVKPTEPAAAPPAVFIPPPCTATHTVPGGVVTPLPPPEPAAAAPALRASYLVSYRESGYPETYTYVECDTLDGAVTRLNEAAARGARSPCLWREVKLKTKFIVEEE